MHASDWEKQRAENSTVLFPGRISVEQAKKLPMTFLQTAEMDFERRDAFVLAETLKQAGRLAGISDWPGAYHGWTTLGDHPDYAIFHEEFRQAILSYCK